MKRLLALALTVGIGSVAMASCVEVNDGKLAVINRSNRPIIFTYGDEYAGDSLPKEPPYDIDLQGYPMFTGTEGQKKYNCFVLPYATKRMWANGHWEEIFRNDTSNRRKTSAYFLDADTVRKYSWSAIRRKGLVLARFRFSRRDLEQLGWHIVYSAEDAASVHRTRPKLAQGRKPELRQVERVKQKGRGCCRTFRAVQNRRRRATISV